MMFEPPILSAIEPLAVCKPRGVAGPPVFREMAGKKTRKGLISCCVLVAIAVFVFAFDTANRTERRVVEIPEEMSI
jgi:hypothetical protein